MFDLIFDVDSAFFSLFLFPLFFLFISTHVASATLEEGSRGKRRLAR